MNAMSGSKSTPLEGDAANTVLTFRLERQVYAISIAPIMQLIEMVTITPLPEMPIGLEGLINVHGKITPVVSLHPFVGVAKPPRALHTPIILLRLANDFTVGLIVDEILEVIPLPEAPAPPAAFLPPGLQVTSMVRGVVYHNSHMILLLDHEALFTTAQTEALTQATADGAAMLETP